MQKLGLTCSNLSSGASGLQRWNISAVVPTGNKANTLSSVNHKAKTIHHHYAASCRYSELILGIMFRNKFCFLFREKKKPLKKWNSTTGNYEFFGLKILLMNANNSRRWQKFLKNSDAFEAGNHDFFYFFKKREIEWVIDNDNNRQWQKDKIKGLDTYTTAR